MADSIDADFTGTRNPQSDAGSTIDRRIVAAAAGQHSVAGQRVVSGHCLTCSLCDHAAGHFWLYRSGVADCVPNFWQRHGVVRRKCQRGRSEEASSTDGKSGSAEVGNRRTCGSDPRVYCAGGTSRPTGRAGKSVRSTGAVRVDYDSAVCRFPVAANHMESRSVRVRICRSWIFADRAHWSHFVGRHIVDHDV